MIQALESSYLARAAIELIILSLLSGLVGTIIVLRKKSFFAVALSHATFPGGVIAALLGVGVMIGQALAALLLSILLAFLNRQLIKLKILGATGATGIVLAFGFALGALLSSLNLGNQVPVDALLIGSLFGVQIIDLFSALIVFILSSIALLCWGRGLIFATFDPVGFKSSGGNNGFIEALATVLLAATVVVAMPAVGAILTVALVIGPPAAALMIAPNLKWVPGLAILLALIASFLGLWASLQWSIAAGGAIGLAVAVIFLAIYLLKHFYAIAHHSAKKPVARA